MTGRWSVVAGSIAGAAHARAGVSSQDAYAIEEVDGALVVAVADGASGAPLAATGASLVVSLAVREFGSVVRRNRPKDGAQWSALLQAGSDRTLRRFRRAVGALARGGDLRPAELATTVTVVVASPPWVGVLAVGDGFVVARAADGHLDLLLAPPDGTGLRPGATALLRPAAPASDRARRLVAWLPELTGIATGTDGMETLLIEYAGARPRQPGAAPFERLFALADAADPDESALTRMLAGQRVGALTDDDRTLVMAVPR